MSLLKAFENENIVLLYDQYISSIKSRVKSLKYNKLPNNTSIIFFTSGTTGEPVGVLKSKDHLLEELRVLKKLFQPLGIERIIVTVPLVHIYGFLAGVLLPKALGIDVVLKEEFLPHELLELAKDEKTLCVTTPVFLNVLNKLNIEKKYKNIIFLSSTGKLNLEIIKSLNKKIDCTIYQLFGSTETGGIAYKINDDELWKPLEGVKISQSGHNLAVNSKYISDFVIEKEILSIEKPFVTTDIIELHANHFKLLGRESEIIKISGKRISLLEIESFLENSEFIEEALVKLAYDIKSHKDEQLDIEVISSLDMQELKTIIQVILKENYKKINIRTNVKYVKEIVKNYMGKKIRNYKNK